MVFPDIFPKSKRKQWQGPFSITLYTHRRSFRLIKISRPIRHTRTHTRRLYFLNYSTETQISPPNGRPWENGIADGDGGALGVTVKSERYVASSDGAGWSHQHRCAFTLAYRLRNGSANWSLLFIIDKYLSVCLMLTGSISLVTFNIYFGVRSGRYNLLSRFGCFFCFFISIYTICAIECLC